MSDQAHRLRGLCSNQYNRCATIDNDGQASALGLQAHQLKEAGFLARDLKGCGLKPSLVFDLAELKKEGFAVKVSSHD